MMTSGTPFARVGWGFASHTALATLLLCSGATQLYSRISQETKAAEATPQTTDSFFCNTKALNPAEREHHKLLTAKLISKRTQIVELDKGYEFQFRPSEISLAELGGWVVTEVKCCPFFDFHIDLENQ